MTTEKVKEVIDRVVEKHEDDEHPLDLESPHTDLEEEIHEAESEVGVRLSGDEMHDAMKELV
jgi:23S rRNA G2445 N2-methylase RlmL